MNYIKQVNAFYKLLPNNPLSSNAQCLYFYLLNKNNELGWIKEFTVSNMIVCGFTSLSRQALDRARNELKIKGYIDYKKGFSNQAGKYLIVCFDTQNDIQSETQDNTQNKIQDNTQGGHKVCTLTKQNKTKQNKTRSSSIKFYMENINPLITAHEVEILDSYSNKMPEDLIIHAIQEAIEHKAMNMKYIKSILDRYIRENIKTVEQIEYKNAIEQRKSKRQETAKEEAERLRKEWGLGDED